MIKVIAVGLFIGTLSVVFEYFFIMKLLPITKIKNIQLITQASEKIKNFLRVVLTLSAYLAPLVIILIIYQSIYDSPENEFGKHNELVFLGISMPLWGVSMIYFMFREIVKKETENSKTN
jgi:hypothetical protein